MSRQTTWLLLLMAGLLLVVACAVPTGTGRTVGVARTGTRGHVYKFWSLKNRTADHRSPDALVYIPPGFDSRKSIRLVIYNHGLMQNVDETFKLWQLDSRMRLAPANTALILPEWAYDPADYSCQAGCFHEPGFFRNMLIEIMNHTPELKATPLSRVKEIAIVTYSGGFRAAASEIYRNGIYDKVHSLVLLDSLYGEHHFDPWIKANLKALACGRKQYHNFFFDTKRNSIAQYERVQQMFKDAGIKHPSLTCDLKNDTRTLDASQLSRRGIVYKYTTTSTPDFIPHQNVARVYFPIAMKAWSLRTQTASQLAVR